MGEGVVGVGVLCYLWLLLAWLGWWVWGFVGFLCFMFWLWWADGLLLCLVFVAVAFGGVLFFV